MPVFSYKGRDERGALVEGRVDATTVDAVAVQLMNTGITPIDINQQEDDKADGSKSVLEFLRNRRPSLEDLILFSRQMYSLMRAGVPLGKAMTGLAQSTRNRQMVEAQRDILIDLESGRGLAGSLARHPGIFPTLYISMIRVGEESGRLDESFRRVALYLEREKETRERIKAALRYPIFVLIAIAVAIAIINIWVIPAFAKLFASAGATLPWQTRLLIATSDFFVAWWPLMAIAIAAGIAWFRHYVGTEQGRYNWDHMKLRIPVVGGILHRATLARFSRAFSMALSSGVPLIQAMTVVAHSVDNEYLGDRILGMRNVIERGESLTRTATLAGMFTPLALQMMAVGEETGQVDELLSEVADYYEREVDYDVRNLSASIEPLMIIAIGVMVLILALGVFLPMWDLTRVIK